MKKRFLLVAALIGLSAFMSCQSAPIDCPGCGGCCDSYGICVPGTQTVACGSHGTACSACAANQVCSAGACMSPDAG